MAKQPSRRDLRVPGPLNSPSWRVAIQGALQTGIVLIGALLMDQQRLGLLLAGALGMTSILASAWGWGER